MFNRLFLVLLLTYSQDATTDIDAKYVKRRGSVQGCAFSGPQNQILTFTPAVLTFAKPAFLRPDFDGTGYFKNFARKQL